MSIYFTFVLILFNVFTYSAIRVLTTLLALKLGAEAMTIGLLAAAFSIFPMLLSWHAGKMTDRFGMRWPIMIGASANTLILLMVFLVPTMPVVFVCAVVFGVGCMFYSISMQSLVGTISTLDNRAQNFSNAAIVVSIANATGPLFAGFSIDSYGHAQAFLFLAGLMVVPVVLLAVWGHRLPGATTGAAPARGIRHTLTNPKLWPVLAASSLAQGGVDMYLSYLPVYADSHGLSASAIGVILAICAAGGMISRLVLKHLIAWLSEEKLFAYALFFGAFGFVAVPFFESAAALAVISFILGFGLYCTQPVALTLIYNRAAHGRAGEALGLRFALDNAAKLAGPLAFGAAATTLGLSVMFWISGLLLGSGGAIARYDAGKNSGSRETATHVN